MRYLLNVVYLLTLVAVSPWLLYAAIKKGKYREGGRAKLFGLVPHRKGSEPCVWCHAVSAGEVNLLQPLISRLAAETDWEIVISTTTKTGFALAQERYSDHVVFHCPLDFSWSVERALRRIRPSLLVLAELEIWPNLLSAARRQDVKTAIVNGRLSEKSARGYARLGKLLRTTFASFDLIAVQDDVYAQRFVDLGAVAERVITTGSLKFDGAQTNRRNSKTTQLRRLSGIATGAPVLLAGSTQAGEERLVVQAFVRLRQQCPQLRLILVPRHPERFSKVATLLQELGVSFRRRTELPTTDTGVLLVDVVGELGAWWGMADIGFVGGSIGGRRGGQSMIEPAAYGVACCFGPNTQNFREIVKALLSRDAATVVANENQLFEFAQQCLLNHEWASSRGDRARQLVRQNLGAAQRTCARLQDLLETSSPVNGCSPVNGRAKSDRHRQRLEPTAEPGEGPASEAQNLDAA